MPEVVLRGGIGVFPRAEGGRQLVVEDGGIYRIPLDPDLHKQLAHLLSLDDAELETELNRKAAADRLAVTQRTPNGRPASLT